MPKPKPRARGKLSACPATVGLPPLGRAERGWCEAEARKCAGSLAYWSAHYVRVPSRATGRLIPFAPRPAQLKVRAARDASHWVYVLKSRKLGVSTEVAIENLWRAQFRPGFGVLVVSESQESARTIGAIYTRTYRGQPRWLRELFPLVNDTPDHLRYAHGSDIRISSASARSFRGDTRHALHFSEFAHYLDFDAVQKAAFATRSDNADVILETTANGINEAHRIWTETPRYTKVFLDPRDDESATYGEPPTRTDARITALAEELGFSDGLANWCHERFWGECAGNWAIFRQNYPFSAEMSFVSSGDRFFPIVFANANSYEGPRRWGEKEAGHVYCMGVDTATGSRSPGADSSAWVVLDVTDPRHLREVSTYLGVMVIPEFAPLVHAEAEYWGALLIPEANGCGLSLIEHIMSVGYARIWARTAIAKYGNNMSNNVGFLTTAQSRMPLLGRLLRAVVERRYEPQDARIKAQMNSFVYKTPTRAEHASGEHDDLIFAGALAITGIAQAAPVRAAVAAEERPRTPAEAAAYEFEHGYGYDPTSTGVKAPTAALLAGSGDWGEWY